MAEQYTAAIGGVAFRRMPERLLVNVVGDDRVEFMQGMSSQNIKALQPGMVSYGLVLTERAHVVADFYVYARERDLVLEVDRKLWPRAKQQLEKLIVADDVELLEDEETGVLEILGPSAEFAIADALSDFLTTPQPGYYVAAEKLTVACFERRGCRSFTAVGGSAALTNLVARLTRDGAATPAFEVTAEALDIVRIENGVPCVGLDTDVKTIALEARLEPGISFGKGCYLGQETIERISAHGQLKKRLFGLRVQADLKVERGAGVFLEGNEVGRVTSAALSPRLGSLALAILHHSSWTPNTAVTVEDSRGRVAAVVSDLPFV
jgi:folate-binding protein YgfZ